MPLILILAIAAVGGAVFFFAELATSPMRNRRNLVHRAANYGRLRTVTGKEPSCTVPAPLGSGVLFLSVMRSPASAESSPL